MAASGAAAIKGVMTPEVGGVRMRRHPIELEAVRAMTIARRVGKMLVRWVKSVEGQTQVLERVVGRDPESGHDIREDVVDELGRPIKVPVLPGDDFRKSWDLYERTVRNMLAEQRARAAMTQAKGAMPIDDATFQESLRDLARQTVLEMPAHELEGLLALRKMASPVRAETTDDPARAATESATSVSVTASQTEGASTSGGNGDFLSGLGDDSER